MKGVHSGVPSQGAKGVYCSQKGVLSEHFVNTLVNTLKLKHIKVLREYLWGVHCSLKNSVHSEHLVNTLVNTLNHGALRDYVKVFTVFVVGGVCPPTPPRTRRRSRAARRGGGVSVDTSTPSEQRTVNTPASLEGRRTLEGHQKWRVGQNGLGQSGPVIFNGSFLVFLSEMGTRKSGLTPQSLSSLSEVFPVAFGRVGTKPNATAAQLAPTARTGAFVGQPRKEFTW